MIALNIRTKTKINILDQSMVIFPVILGNLTDYPNHQSNQRIEIELKNNLNNSIRIIEDMSANIPSIKINESSDSKK